MITMLLSLLIASLLIIMPFALLEPLFFFTMMALVLAAGFASMVAVFGEMWLRRVSSRR